MSGQNKFIKDGCQINYAVAESLEEFHMGQYKGKEPPVLIAYYMGEKTNQ